ncbi:MAG: 4-phosphoerythronate dehydrogenase [Coxiellaceae bacterium]|nr:MAG: 4-phosphoerythronate dehydrogenase [Coxiellaceae bacterium]
MLKIIADENIPYAAELFGNWGTVISLPGRDINAELVKDADILLVRSVTSVNADLLTKSRLKFVGSATAGLDHIDLAWLQQAGIAFADAKGLNANAVAEYVVSCVAWLRQSNILLAAKPTAAIIGVGNVGKKVASHLSLLGFKILCNDPPRATTEADFPQTPLTALTIADLICLHTPLLRHGAHPTYHLIEQNFLSRLKPGSVILNAGRGAVVDNTAITAAGQHLKWCLDVWEHEPNLDLKILEQTILATPHIAGYTLEAKLRGTLLLFEAAQSALNLSVPMITKPLLSEYRLTLTPHTHSWESAVLQIYNPYHDTQSMRRQLLAAETNIAQSFDALRRHYVRRREFASITLHGVHSLPKIDQEILTQLGMRLAS